MLVKTTTTTTTNVLSSTMKEETEKLSKQRSPEKGGTVDGFTAVVDTKAPLTMKKLLAPLPLSRLTLPPPHFMGPRQWRFLTWYGRFKAPDECEGIRKGEQQQQQQHSNSRWAVAYNHPHRQRRTFNDFRRKSPDLRH